MQDKVFGPMNQAMRWHLRSLCLTLLVSALWLSGCGAPVQARPVQAITNAPVTVAVQQFAAQEACLGYFVAHDLPHTTHAPGDVTRLFDSNGAGLAVNDLDNDGDLDIVLANLSAPATLLWNEGDLVFRASSLPLMRRARAVAAVDVDGDGWIDLTFTNGAGAVAYFRNNGLRDFDLTPLPGVSQPAYAMHWADWDADGDLDLVTGSYDAGLMLEQANTLLFGQGGGVTYYAQADGAFVAQRLADEAQALAITAMDLNGDRRLDIVVGNDFDLPDYVYLQNADGSWQATEPFPRTTHSTMGFDRVDSDNDGRWELFATDMKPYQRNPAVLAAWTPLMQDGYETRRSDDRQRSENMLHAPTAQGGFRNQAYRRGLDATGWSWSAKFGDLDSDGRPDLYAVNGMIAADLLDYLPDGELVEENQALRNSPNNRFVAAPEWGLNSQRSGRSMSMADLDDDGDLDIIVNNLNSPAQLFENRLCGGSSLSVALRWPAVTNRFGPWCGDYAAHLHRRPTPRSAQRVRLSVGRRGGGALWPAGRGYGCGADHPLARRCGKRRLASRTAWRQINV